MKFKQMENYLLTERFWLGNHVENDSLASQVLIVLGFADPEAWVVDGETRMSIKTLSSVRMVGMIDRLEREAEELQKWSSWAQADDYDGRIISYACVIAKEIDIYHDERSHQRSRSCTSDEEE